MFVKEMHANLAEKIKSSGWAHMGIMSSDIEKDGFSFDYSIGLTEQNLPELLICLPIRKEIANLVISNVIALWKEKGFSTGVTTQILQDMRIELVEVDVDVACNNYAFQAREYYRETSHVLRVVQIVMPDESGKLPGEEGYSMYQQTLVPRLNVSAQIVK